ncbi:MAG TPA: PIG-L deacetylase family protein [Trebonia sp.]|jgi:LmbE family N-acetylglucosaminyl deacetylase|nr:PIG-L deacetylase family protein [Trebonia sp.]
MAGNQVVVIGAHPDDELLGAGGTIARHARAGDDVHAIVVADGAGSRYPAHLADTLEKQARRAAEIIGLASLRFLALPDQRLDTIPLIELTQRLEAVLDDIGPRTVYTHFPEDVNDDHRIVARCAWVACRPYRRQRLVKFAVFETPSSTEWAWPLPGTSLQPNLFVDITDTIDVKIAAMECYETELRDYPHPRSPRALRERAAHWGSHIGRRAAEPFRVLREVI